MSPPPSSPSPDIARLAAEGYRLTVGASSLTVHGVPFVDRNRGVRRGEIILPLWRRDGRIVPPRGHVAQFVGGIPCDRHGRELPLGGAAMDRQDRRGLCIRPEDREFADYHEMVTAYVQRIEAPAMALRPSASARTRRGSVRGASEGPLQYGDPSQIRDAVDGFAERVEGGSIGIVGLGGTGSYVLDLVAKTGVAQIHLFDDDEFQQHNAFRAPGAPTRAEAESGISKVDRYAEIYSRMHAGIVPHRTSVGLDNVALLDLLDFAFLCLDDPHAKPAIIGRLERNGTAFVDCGIGTILLSEEEEHVLCRRTVRGVPAPRGLLASIPRDADPQAHTVIRAIDIAVLRMAVNCGAIQVVRFGRKPVTPPSDPASIVDLVLSGAIFSASRLMPRIDPFAYEDDDR